MSSLVCSDIKARLLAPIHPSWTETIEAALAKVDGAYLQQLATNDAILPSFDKLFNAFSLPLPQVNYILFGESPYPRAASANGYAFWDNAVDTLWSQQGFSKPVNRATSLRNWFKMLLVARGDLGDDTSLEAIKALPKSCYIDTLATFFNRLMEHGFLLLNATLVYEEGKVNQHAKAWTPFMTQLLSSLSNAQHLKLILLGQIAKRIHPPQDMPKLIAEHPYNISFIRNPIMIEFFKPFDLLGKHDNEP